MRTVLILPTYNERDNLDRMVGTLLGLYPEADILIADDNSPDGTGEIADGLACRHPHRVCVLHRKAKDGLGRAYVDAFNHVLKMGYEAVVQMDADFSHDPAQVGDLLARLEDHDLVLGTRYLGGIRVINWGLRRLMLSVFATRYVRIITGMKFSDATGGFKAWRGTALTQIDLPTTRAMGYLFQIETTFRAYRQGLRIAEVPIVFYERRAGTSKMQWRIIAEAVLGVILLRLGSIGVPIRRPVAAPGRPLEHPGPRT